MKLGTHCLLLRLGYTMLVLGDIFADSLASLISLMFTDTRQKGPEPNFGFGCFSTTDQCYAATGDHCINISFPLATQYSER